MKNQTTFTKQDAPRCTATIHVSRVLVDNSEGDYFTASVQFRDNGIPLFRQSAGTVRLSRGDAYADGVQIIKDTDANFIAN